MRSDADSWFDGSAGHWRNDWRRLLTGLGYNATVVFGLMTLWAMQDFASALPKHSLAQSLGNTGRFYLIMMVHQVPMVPVLTIALNLAPRAGVWRYAWLVTALMLMWGFCTICWYVMGLHTLNLEYALIAAMIVTACAYRSSARTATSVLTQHEIDGAALDSDLKRARLDLLRAQIEPHFLFNTLATVRALARIDCAAAAEMVDNLMRYLSEAQPKLRHDESSLAEEMQLIEAYLRIYQIRMGARLSYQLVVPEVLRTERIPTMMLLTLVENAVKHGINPAVDGGSIRVSANREPAALVLKVTDSGRGMSATEGHGMGLANIRRRLTMLYGDAAVLSLARPTGRGVEARISIPMSHA